MHKLSFAIVFAGIVTLATAAHAKKPKVCENWLPYITSRTDVKDAPKIYVCFDGKAPSLMINPTIVTTKDKGGNTINLAVEVR